MAMEKPIWTICFALIWCLLALGAVVAHFALADVNPALKELPDRLEKGFDDVLGLATLEGEIQKVKEQAVDVLTQCEIQTSDCPRVLNREQAILTTCSAKTDVDSTTHKAAIMQSFEDGLAKIKRLGEDKYFGVDAVRTAGGQLDTVLTELDKANPTGDCCEQAATYCVIRDNSLSIQGETQDVKDQISKMTNNDAIADFEENADRLVYLHALPYILVLSTVCFSVLWWRSGTCCCCTGGTMLDCLGPIMCQIIFWLIAFVIMGIIAGIGYAVQFWLTDMPIPDGTFNGNPTVGDLLDHIQSEFPDFWKYVFDDLVKGLELLRTAATIFVAVCIFVGIYSCAFCIARPYGDSAKANE